MTVFTYKRIKYKDKFVKFKEPLKIQVNDYEFENGKSVTEVCIPSVMDGYTKEKVSNQEKEVKWYLEYVFNNYLSKSDEELASEPGAIEFKKRYMSIIQS